jgi:protein-disulfide isomerase
VAWRTAAGREATAVEMPGEGAARVPARRPPPAVPKEPVSIDGATLKGSNVAPVVVIEYSEFQCPYCGRFALDTLPSLDRSYIATGKVQLAFRHLPLEKIHPFALSAAMTAECAGNQGRFWEMHDLLFRDQRSLGPSSFFPLAKSLGLDAERFRGCLESDETVAQKVRNEAENARALRVTGTPTFFVGRRLGDGKVQVTQRLSGALPPDRFSAVFDQLLAVR